MDYTSILPLDRVKTYLRLEPTFTAEDTEITSMINAACSFVEKKSEHYLISREREYVLGSDGCIRVYDYPVTGVAAPSLSADYDLTQRPDYLIVEDLTGDNKTVWMNVGYGVAADIPQELLQSALQMIKVWYFESEMQINTTLIPESVKEVLNSYKRFLI